MWGLFLMKKLIKNEIYGSVNSAYVHCSLQKVNICSYCSLNSNRNTPRRVKKKKKNTQLGNADLESKHTLYSWSWTCKENQIGYFFPLFSIQ